MAALYDKIGGNYDTTRKADPEITRRLYHHLQMKDGKEVLDLACGTGNYTIALAQLGVQVTGVDISREMISSAREKASTVEWQLGDVEALPFQSHHFQGATCILAIHHFNDIYQSFNEVHRVLMPGSRFVIFTSSPEQMKRYWLNEYFPEMMNKSMEQMPSLEEVNQALIAAGFKIIGNESFLIQPDLIDFFLYSGKYQPEMYLDEGVRNGISSFASVVTADEVQQGLRRLQEDLNNSVFEQRTKNYYSDLGDYAFVIAES